MISKYLKYIMIHLSRNMYAAIEMIIAILARQEVFIPLPF